MDLSLPVGPGFQRAGGAGLVADVGIAGRPQVARDVDRRHPGEGERAGGDDHVQVAVAVGIDALDVDDLAAHRLAAGHVGRAVRAPDLARRRRNLMSEVLGLATMRLRRALEASLHEDPEVAELLDAVVERRIDPASAASTILARGAIETREAAR